MAKDVDVTIVANLVNGVVEFEMEEGNQYTEMLIFNKTKDKLPKGDEYLINFTLDDNTGKGLKFRQASPIYIGKGSDKHVPKCPKNGNVGSSNDFTIVQPVTDSKLSVQNKDNDECFYKFALNFVDAAGAPHMYDPIFGNQNGGFTAQPPGGGGTTSATVAFIGGALLGVAGTALAFNAGLLG
jgi:hypothetical protein